MAPSLRAALRRSKPEPPAAPPPSVQRAARRASPPTGELRRERRALLRLREDKIRDLGGVVLEMYRQDSFREGLLYDLCAEVAAVEGRLRELDMLLDARRPPVARCACGAPLFRGASFCAGCGLAVSDASASES